MAGAGGFEDGDDAVFGVLLADVVDVCGEGGILVEPVVVLAAGDVGRGEGGWDVAAVEIDVKEAGHFLVDEAGDFAGARACGVVVAEGVGGVAGRRQAGEHG